MRNESLKFVCRDVSLKIENTQTPFTSQYEPGQVITVPVAHGDGNYFADEATLDTLEGEGRVVLRYCEKNGAVTPASNPNGSRRNIAGILNEAGNVLGMMPHPEDMTDKRQGSLDGLGLFTSIASAA